MNRNEADKTASGTLLVTPFAGRGVVKFIGVSNDTGIVEFCHEHFGYPAHGRGVYKLRELTPLDEYPKSCTDGEGHTSHDFTGTRPNDYCRVCQVSGAAVDFLNGKKSKKRKLRCT